MGMYIWFRRLIVVIISFLFIDLKGQDIDLLPSASILNLADRAIIRQGSGASARTKKTTLLDIKNLIGGGGVSSVFGRTGIIVATEGDYTLDQLAGVVITSPTTGQLMRFNGTNWVNVALIDSDIPDLDWSKITSGKPTTLAGYGITNAIPLSGSNAISGNLLANFTGELLVGQQDKSVTSYVKVPTISVSQLVAYPPTTGYQASVSAASQNASTAKVDLLAQGTTSRMFTVESNLPFLFTGADARYNADYSGNYTARSLTDKGYVDGQVSTKQNTLTLTTTGTSGASTLIGNTLNIPQYSGATVAGSNTQVQFNNSGAFGASGNFAWNNTNNRLQINNSIQAVPTASLGITTGSTSEVGLAVRASGTMTTELFRLIASNGDVTTRIDQSGKIVLGYGNASTRNSSIVLQQDNLTRHSSFDGLVNNSNLSIINQGQQNTQLNLCANELSTNRAIYQFAKSRGSITNPTALANNDFIGEFNFAGFDGSAFHVGAIVQSLVDGTVTGGSVPMRISLTTGSNSASRFERLVVKNNGLVGITELAPTATFHVKSVGVGTVTQRIDALASQTANLTEWRNSGGTLLADFTATGSLGVTNIVEPTTNNRFLSFVNNAGTIDGGVEITNATSSQSVTIGVNSALTNHGLRIRGKGASGVLIMANNTDVINVGSTNTTISSRLDLTNDLFLKNAKQLMLQDDDELFQINIKAPTSVTNDYTITLPADAPAPYSSLTYNGSSYEWRRQSLVLQKFVNTVSNTTCNDIYSFTIPPNTMSVNGDMVVFDVSGDNSTIATAAGLNFTMNASTHSEFFVNTGETNGKWEFICKYKRKTSSSVDITVTGISRTSGGVIGNFYDTGIVNALDFGTSIEIKLRGCPTVGSTQNARIGTITFYPAP